MTKKINWMNMRMYLMELIFEHNKNTILVLDECFKFTNLKFSNSHPSCNSNLFVEAKTAACGTNNPRLTEPHEKLSWAWLRCSSILDELTFSSLIKTNIFVFDITSVCFVLRERDNNIIIENKIKIVLSFHGNNIYFFYVLLVWFKR